MKTLLFLRSLMVPHLNPRQSSSSSITSCFVSHSSLRHHLPLISYPFSSSASSSSSFEPPVPPTSRGHSVFPDIKFTTPRDQESNSYKRNSDTEAVFVVNASSRGIGLQFVKSLVVRTKGKIVACCRSPGSANELQQIAYQYSERIEILPLDMEDQQTIDSLALHIAEKYQRVDALFNVAGILGDGNTTTGPERALAAIDRDWMEKSLAVNVIGPVMLAKSLSPLLRTTGRKIVTIGNATDAIKVSLPSNRPTTVIANLSARVGSISDNQLGGWYTYRLSKAALNQATKTMGLELKRQGTMIVALHPGTTDTGLSKPFQKNVKVGRLFPVDFTVDSLLAVVDSLSDDNNGGFYDWAGKAIPF